VTFDLADVIDEVSETVTVTRALASELVKGRAKAPPADRVFKIRGSFQPMPTKELQLLPEGMRVSGAAKFFTDYELRTVDTSECKVPDRIAHQGVTWQVHRVDNWGELGNYYRVVLVRLGQ